MDYQHVLQLIDLLEASSTFSEVRLRSGDFEIELRRGGGGGGTGHGSVGGSSGVGGTGHPAAPTPLAPAAAPAAPLASAAPTRPAALAPRTWPAGHHVIQAPMVGTFYRAPEPGAAPFVAVGQAVRPGDTLCIIEVMKLMNTIASEGEGVVVEILVEDGQAVAHGQDLIVIAPR